MIVRLGSIRVAYLFAFVLYLSDCAFDDSSRWMDFCRFTVPAGSKNSGHPGKKMPPGPLWAGSYRYAAPGHGMISILRGGGQGSGDGSSTTARKGHSSVFLQDAAQRMQKTAGGRIEAEESCTRLPHEILLGAIRRNAMSTTVAATESAEAAKLSVAELRSKLQVLGATDTSIRACSEKRDLVDLIKTLTDSSEVVQWRQERRHGDSREFQVSSVSTSRRSVDFALVICIDSNQGLPRIWNMLCPRSLTKQVMCLRMQIPEMAADIAANLENLQRLDSDSDRDNASPDAGGHPKLVRMRCVGPSHLYLGLQMLVHVSLHLAT